MALRPEKINLNAADLEEITSFLAWSTKWSMSAPTPSHHVKLDNGTILMVRQQNVATLPDTRFHTGDRVDVSWPIASSKAFAN